NLPGAHPDTGSDAREPQTAVASAIDWKGRDPMSALAAEKPRLCLSVSIGGPMRPRLVVTTITPLAPLDPYNAAAAGPLRTSTRSISARGTSVIRLIPLSLDGYSRKGSWSIPVGRTP